MSSAYDDLLNRLGGVRTVQSPAQSVVRAHRATCPSCDKKLKLSLAETSDGTVLIHCHRGCGTGDVLDALSMNARDLFPGDGPHSSPRRRLQRGIGQWLSGAAIADEIHTYAALFLSDDLDDDDLIYIAHRLTIGADRLQSMLWTTAAAVAGEIVQQARAVLACEPGQRWMHVQHIAVLARVLDQSARAEAKAARARRAAA